MTRTSGVGEVSRLAIDDLAVGSQRDIADRAQPIGDRGDAQLVQKGGDHGQAPECLLACDEDSCRILSQLIRSGRSPVAGGRLVVR